MMVPGAGMEGKGEGTRFCGKGKAGVG
jgi:hypothetical protein